MGKKCDVCGEDAAQGKYAKLCVQCRTRRRKKPPKFAWSSEQDAVLAECYRLYYRVRAISTAARRIGYPRHVCKRRAQRIGLSVRAMAYPKWGTDELRILEANAWRGDRQIAEILQSAGFQRSVCAVQVQRKRRGMQRDGYSARELSLLLGLGDDTVASWCRTGTIRAERRGTNRAATRDVWHISHEAARRFVLEHPTRITLGRVTDALWFIDLVAGGAGLTVDAASAVEGVKSAHATQIAGRDLPG
jgi:hypothetical protein